MPDLDRAPGREPPVDTGVGGAAGLGGVLGDVSGQLGVAGVAEATGGDRPDINGAPPQPQNLPVRSPRLHTHLSRRFPHHLIQDNRGDPVRGRRTGTVGTVDADDGMEVNEPPPLVFGHFGIRDPQVFLQVANLHTTSSRQEPVDTDAEPVPQIASMGLPQHRPDVVIGVDVECLTKPRIGFGMPDPARARTRHTRTDLGPGVDPAETRGGQRREHPRSHGNPGVDLLRVVTGQTRPDQVERILGVPAGARLAQALTTGPARHRDPPRSLMQHLTRAGVRYQVSPPQPHRRRTPTRRLNSRPPIVIPARPDQRRQFTIQLVLIDHSGQHSRYSSID